MLPKLSCLLSICCMLQAAWNGDLGMLEERIAAGDNVNEQDAY
eukprot:COSAG02_NODE_48245_length_335_cov_0.762712_2_plen_42_part_01